MSNSFLRIVNYLKRYLLQALKQQQKYNEIFFAVQDPAHLGCCLAISKRFFDDLGIYDNELLMWGGENLELSFKVQNLDFKKTLFSIVMSF